MHADAMVPRPFQFHCCLAVQKSTVAAAAVAASAAMRKRKNFPPVEKRKFPFRAAVLPKIAFSAAAAEIAARQTETRSCKACVCVCSSCSS